MYAVTRSTARDASMGVFSVALRTYLLQESIEEETWFPPRLLKFLALQEFPGLVPGFGCVSVRSTLTHPNPALFQAKAWRAKFLRTEMIGGLVT